MIGVNEWVRQKIQIDGYEATIKAYEEYKGKFGDKSTQESYARTCRRMRRELQSKFDPRVTTLEDAIAFHEVDTSRFGVSSLTVNSWGQPGNLNTQVKVKLDPMERENSFKDLVQSFKDDVKNHKPQLITTPWTKQTGKLLEIKILDLHLGLLSWGAETGQDYDLKIAKEVFLEYVSKIVAWGQVMGCERILFPIGHDFFNSDTPENTTTKGTRQDEDTRWHKTFVEGWKVVRDALEVCLSVAPHRRLYYPRKPRHHANGVHGRGA